MKNETHKTTKTIPLKNGKLSAFMILFMLSKSDLLALIAT
jgi:hypothetical protein